MDAMSFELICALNMNDQFFGFTKNLKHDCHKNLKIITMPSNIACMQTLVTGEERKEFFLSSPPQ